MFWLYLLHTLFSSSSVFLQCLFGYNRINTEFTLMQYKFKFEDIIRKIIGWNLARGVEIFWDLKTFVNQELCH